MTIYIVIDIQYMNYSQTINTATLGTDGESWQAHMMG